MSLEVLNRFKYRIQNPSFTITSNTKNNLTFRAVYIQSFQFQSYPSFGTHPYLIISYLRRKILSPAEAAAASYWWNPKKGGKKKLLFLLGQMTWGDSIQKTSHKVTMLSLWGKPICHCNYWVSSTHWVFFWFCALYTCFSLIIITKSRNHPPQNPQNKSKNPKSYR